MNRKDFLRWGSTGLLGTAFGFEAGGKEDKMNYHLPDFDPQSYW